MVVFAAEVGGYCCEVYESAHFMACPAGTPEDIINDGMILSVQAR
jgi:hypothetical protein